jgi:hypothetical protein
VKAKHYLLAAGRYALIVLTQLVVPVAVTRELGALIRPLIDKELTIWLLPLLLKVFG